MNGRLQILPCIWRLSVIFEQLTESTGSMKIICLSSSVSDNTPSVTEWEFQRQMKSKKMVAYMRKGDYEKAFEILKNDHFGTGRNTALKMTLIYRIRTCHWQVLCIYYLLKCSSMTGIHFFEYSLSEYSPLFRHQSETSALSHME